MSGFDFKTLTAKPAAVPAPKGGGGRRAMDPNENPFVALLVQSKEQDTGLQVEIPKSQIGAAKSLCRRAAIHLDLGVRIVIQPDEKSEAFGKLGDSAKVKMLFQWKVKTERKRRSKPSENGAGQASTNSTPETAKAAPSTAAQSPSTRK